MSESTAVDEILDFAIEREQEAVDFYTDLAGQATSQATRASFEQFANEERGHKAKLEAVKGGKRLRASAKAIQDLKIGDYLVDEAPGPKTDYQGALIVAMKREKAAFRLYTDLAARTDDVELRDLLLGLAQEEAKHKLRFEVEYDEKILTEN
jgi:rubrerythrin